MAIKPSKAGHQVHFCPGMAISIHTASAGVLILTCLIVSIKVSQATRYLGYLSLDLILLPRIGLPIGINADWPPMASTAFHAGWHVIYV